MEYKNILELWDRFEHSAVTEMSLDFHGTKFSLKKGTGALSSREAFPVQEEEPSFSAAGNEKTERAASPLTAAGNSQDEIPAISEQPAEEEKAGFREIKAPLVGTFYRSPSPEEAPFVEVGQTVKKGDVIGIIEAMKLMNEVTAQEEGVVAEILAEDAQLVGFDDPLIRLK